MIVVVDYGRGNLYSIGQALTHLGVSHEITGVAEKVSQADRIVLPGVGAFGDAMAGLRTRGLVEPLLQAARRGIPLIGICLGMQMLSTSSEEFGTNAGLGLIPGVVRRLPEGNPSAPETTRIPNVGWRRLDLQGQCPLTSGLAAGTMMYFVHSYAPEPDDKGNVAATIDVNGKPAAAIIWRDNIYGCQFHPEKSGAAGLGLLRRFLTLGT